MPIDKLYLAVLASVGSAAALAQTTTPQPEPISIEAVSSPQELLDLKCWIAETLALLKSKEFKNNLSSLSVDYTRVSFGSRSASVAELSKVVGLEYPYRFYPTPVALVGNQWNSTVLTGHNGERINGILVTSMAVGRQHFARFRSANAVERSCAINTMAHEISHTITDSPTLATGVIEDTGTSATIGAATPIASYLMGSVAQCTYLQKVGRIKEEELRSCIAVFGDSEFNNGRCNQFNADEPLQWPKRAPRP